MKGIEIISFPILHDPRGDLSVVEQYKEIPFDIKRVFWIFNVPEGEKRAQHAHVSQEQLIVALAGEFKITVDNGKEKQIILMNSPVAGLHVSPRIWISLEDFSRDAVCLVISSGSYDPKDYIRDYQSFLDLVNQT